MERVDIYMERAHRWILRRPGLLGKKVMRSWDGKRKKTAGSSC